MPPFEEFWYRLQLELATWTRIRNWTEHGGYTSKERWICFQARSYLACSENQKRWVDPHLGLFGRNWIVCSNLRGNGFCKVSKEEFRNVYDQWTKYRNGQIKRADLGKSGVSSYTISILKWFEDLPEDTPAALALATKAN
ncbi:MAG: hypothetical protein JOZ10_16355 [Acidobacteria bacterium]|nr:hypothetical protein [Acidobacteriota bacterium]MBV9144652.1 hypothetical protein [Acidobacteriota bacterium]MBV9438230.1 hypothetical protein [Acidobacteriota bacterium]